ncbi:hypothetical protein [uncultured Sulfitobacter sp.]|uniref:hypothetical protein n=1 Tax=uncultured Sulfitobacter sp. TaxID=191468 RepID=UPI00260304AB|nr:hypothetical protein [uncultured Sulfitobacter sp.]
MIKHLSTLALALALATPAAAQTFRAENRVDVTPVANGFAIADGNGQWARGMWCAAADYARDVLGAGGTQRIYVAKSKGRGAGNPVIFTLDPTGLTPSSVTFLSSSIKTPGANLSVDQANVYCADFRLRNGR